MILPLTTGLVSPRVGREIIHGQLGMEVEFPLVPPHRSEGTLAGMVEEGVEIGFARDEVGPFCGRVPVAAQGDRGIERRRGVVSGDGIGLADEQGADVAPVDEAIGRDFHARESGERRIPVHGMHDVRGLVAAADADARPPGDAGDADPTLPSGDLMALNRLLFSASRSAAVVGGIDDDGFIFNAEFLEGVDDPADVMIELLDGIAVFAQSGASFESFADPKRIVQHGVRQIDEKRLLRHGMLVAGVITDEGDRLVGIKVGEFVGIGRTLDDFAIAYEWNSALVFEMPDLDRIEIVEQAEVVIEALLARQERLVKAEVPLADAGGGVAIGLQEFGEGELERVNAERRSSR